MTTLLIFYLLITQLGISVDAQTSSAAREIEVDDAVVKVYVVDADEEEITWEVHVNEARQHYEGIKTKVKWSNNMIHHSIEAADQLDIEQTDEGYVIEHSSNDSDDVVEVTTKISSGEIGPFTLRATTTVEETPFTSVATLDSVTETTHSTEISIDEQADETAETEVTTIKAKPPSVADEEGPTTKRANNEEKATEVANAPSEVSIRSASSSQMEYDASSYSKDVRNYNGIIFGDHYINGGDNEGATAIRGNIIVEGGFDYGAADSGNPNLIGTQPLPRDTPGLLLGGVVQGTGQIGYFNGAVLTEHGDPNNSLSARSGHKVFVSESELNDVFTHFRDYVDQHEQNLIPFVTSSPQNEINFSDSTENDKVLVAHVTGNHFSLGSVDFPNLDDYDKVLIMSDAETVNFSNGAIFYDGVMINTSAPYYTENGFEQVATKLTWLFPNATKIESSGYGVVGTIIAPDANYIGNGGSLNGQLFINDLKSYGGFELHQIRNKVEDPFYGQIKIRKVDSEDESITLAGATFEVIDDDGDVVATLTTDANGEAISEELPVGTYTIVEIEAPENYEPSNDVIEVIVEKDEMIEVTIKNERTPIPTGQLEIIKVDEADHSIRLEGATFRLIDDAGNVVMELVTDANGEAKTGDLPIGDYTLEEIEAPEDYELLSEVISVTVVSKGTVEKTIENKKIPDPLGSITVMKVDEADDHLFLADAMFTLYDENGNHIATLTTDTEGKIVFPDLSLGKYTIKETKAPPGYRMLLKEVEIELTRENPDVTKVIENTRIDWTIPETGGIGTAIFYVIGIALMAVALWFIFRKRKV